MTIAINTRESTREEKILAQARDRFNQISAAEYSIRAAALEDIRFTYNVDEGQWPDQIRTERERDGRPCLTANKLSKFVAIVANQERENRIAVKIVPVDAQSDPDVAQVLEDLVRQIEYQSGADVIYASAGEQAAAANRNHQRIDLRIGAEQLRQVALRDQARDLVIGPAFFGQRHQERYRAHLTSSRAALVAT